VNSSSEVLTAAARAMATRAWQVPPFNVYAATETGGIAAECKHHRLARVLPSRGHRAKPGLQRTKQDRRRRVTGPPYFQPGTGRPTGWGD
jgi:hypothetical protein